MSDNKRRDWTTAAAGYSGIVGAGALRHHGLEESYGKLKRPRLFQERRLLKHPQGRIPYVAGMALSVPSVPAAAMATQHLLSPKRSHHVEYAKRDQKPRKTLLEEGVAGVKQSISSRNETMSHPAPTKLVLANYGVGAAIGTGAGGLAGHLLKRPKKPLPASLRAGLASAAAVGVGTATLPLQSKVIEHISRGKYHATASGVKRKKKLPKRPSSVATVVDGRPGRSHMHPAAVREQMGPVGKALRIRVSDLSALRKPGYTAPTGLKRLHAGYALVGGSHSSAPIEFDAKALRAGYKQAGFKNSAGRPRRLSRDELEDAVDIETLRHRPPSRQLGFSRGSRQHGWPVSKADLTRDRLTVTRTKGQNDPHYVNGEVGDTGAIQAELKRRRAGGTKWEKLTGAYKEIHPPRGTQQTPRPAGRIQHVHTVSARRALLARPRVQGALAVTGVAGAELGARRRSKVDKSMTSTGRVMMSPDDLMANAGAQWTTKMSGLADRLGTQKKKGRLVRTGRNRASDVAGYLARDSSMLGQAAGHVGVHKYAGQDMSSGQKRASVMAAGQTPLIGDLAAASMAARLAPPDQRKSAAALQLGGTETGNVIGGAAGAYGAVQAAKHPVIGAKAKRASDWIDTTHTKLRARAGLKVKAAGPTKFEQVAGHSRTPKIVRGALKPLLKNPKVAALGGIGGAAVLSQTGGAVGYGHALKMERERNAKLGRNNQITRHGTGSKAIAKRDASLMSNKEQGKSVQRKKRQARLSRVGGLIGIGALTATLGAKAPGIKGTHYAEKLASTQTPLLTAGAGLGGYGALNASTIQNREAKIEEKAIHKGYALPHMRVSSLRRRPTGGSVRYRVAGGLVR